MSKITRVFLNSDLRSSHDGLIQRAEEEGVKAIKQGEFLVFINAKRSMAKCLSGKEAMLFLKPESGRLELQALRYLPKYLGLKGNMAYTKALGDHLATSLKRKREKKNA